MRDLIPIREILKEIMLEMFDEKFQPDCTAHSKAFIDATPSTNEDNATCMKFAQMPTISPRTKCLAVPLHWYR
jgi:hypothetical protein